MRDSGDLTMLDLSNILKWFEKIPRDDEYFERFARTYQKITGLIAIYEDRSEPQGRDAASAHTPYPPGMI